MNAGPIKEGYYRMYRPILSKQGPFYIVGGLTGGRRGSSYTKRVASMNEVLPAFNEICCRIEKENPGIKPENQSYVGTLRK